MATEQEKGIQELLRLPIGDLVDMYEDLPIGEWPADWPRPNDEAAVIVKETDREALQLLVFVREGQIGAEEAIGYVRDGYDLAKKSHPEAEDVYEYLSLLWQGVVRTNEWFWLHREGSRLYPIDRWVGELTLKRADEAERKALKLYLVAQIHAGIFGDLEVQKSIINGLLVCGFKDQAERLLEKADAAARPKKPGPTLFSVN